MHVVQISEHNESHTVSVGLIQRSPSSAVDLFIAMAFGGSVSSVSELLWVSPNCTRQPIGSLIYAYFSESISESTLFLTASHKANEARFMM